MRERGIIMSAPMVRALLDGNKTQTRRVVKLKYPFSAGIAEVAGYHMGTTATPPVDMRVTLRRGVYHHMDFKTFAEKYCPYGVAGDRLWVRETHWRVGKWVKNGKTKTGRQAWRFKITRPELVRFEGPVIKPFRTEEGWHKRPAIFLPKKLARIVRELTRVRVERLTEISYSDALAEGMKDEATFSIPNAIANYRVLWDSLHGKGAWELNPWVWVLEFKRA